MSNKNKHKYIEIVKFYTDEVHHHEEAIKELKEMLDKLESSDSFTEMDYSCGAVPDPTISARKENG